MMNEEMIPVMDFFCLRGFIGNYRLNYHHQYNYFDGSFSLHFLPRLLLQRAKQSNICFTLFICLCQMCKSESTKTDGKEQSAAMTEIFVFHPDLSVRRLPRNRLSKTCKKMP